MSPVFNYNIKYIFYIKDIDIGDHPKSRGLGPNDGEFRVIDSSTPSRGIVIFSFPHNTP